MQKQNGDMELVLELFRADEFLKCFKVHVLDAQPRLWYEARVRFRSLDEKRVLLIFESSRVRVILAETRYLPGYQPCLFPQLATAGIFGRFTGLQQTGGEFPGVRRHRRAVLADDGDQAAGCLREDGYVIGLRQAVIDLGPLAG